MVGHQLVISLAYYNNNLRLQLYFNGSTTCYSEEVMTILKNLLLRIQRVHMHTLAPACRWVPMALTVAFLDRFSPKLAQT